MKGNQSVKLLTGWDLGSGTVSQTLWSKLEHGSWNTHVVSLDPDLKISPKFVSSWILELALNKQR